MFHYRKTRKQYQKHLKPVMCPFCNTEELKKREVIESEHAYIVPNITSYDIWEVRKVVSHLLVIPKRHVASLNELNKVEQAEIMDILAKYEAENYNIYARGMSSNVRSVEHQHTHLIKTDPKSHRGTFFWRKPYIFIKF